MGCTTTLAQAADAQGVRRDSIVALSEGYAISARIAGDTVELLGFRSEHGDGWSVQVIAAGGAGRMTAHLVTQAGATGEVWNSLLFGTAPRGASRVMVDGLDGRGGQVTDGAWAIAFRREDVRPDQLRWEVLDSGGALLESGRGITP